MKKQGDGSVLALQKEEETQVDLEEGRTLATRGGRLVELRAPDGEVELRIEITEEGPVLRAESLRLAMTAEELSLKASKSIEVESEGELALRSRDGTRVESTEGDVRVEGKKIHLN